MLSEQERNILCIDKNFIDVWIGNTGPLPKMNLRMIEELCDFLNIPYYDQGYFPSGDLSYRKDYFKDVLNYANKHGIFENVFEYCVSKRYLSNNLDEEESNKFLFLSREEKRQEILVIRKEKIDELINDLNDILFVDDYEVSFNYENDKFEFNSIKQSVITVDSHIMNYGYLEELYTKGQQALKNQDYDSVITKSRTILEQTFLYILNSRNISIKENGKISQYRGKVNKVLNLNPKNDNWPNDPQDKLKPIKELVSGINKIIDSIATMRDNNSDSHGTLERFTNRKAEAELCLNSAVTISSYYLRINQREKNKLKKNNSDI